MCVFDDSFVLLGAQVGGGDVRKRQNGGWSLMGGTKCVCMCVSCLGVGVSLVCGYFIGLYAARIRMYGVSLLF